MVGWTLGTVTVWTGPGTSESGEARTSQGPVELCRVASRRVGSSRPEGPLGLRVHLPSAARTFRAEFRLHCTPAPGSAPGPSWAGALLGSFVARAVRVLGGLPCIAWQWACFWRLPGLLPTCACALRDCKSLAVRSCTGKQPPTPTPRKGENQLGGEGGVVGPPVVPGMEGSGWAPLPKPLAGRVPACHPAEPALGVGPPCLPVPPGRGV